MADSVAVFVFMFVFCVLCLGTLVLLYYCTSVGCPAWKDQIVVSWRRPAVIVTIERTSLRVTNSISVFTFTQLFVCSVFMCFFVNHVFVCIVVLTEIITRTSVAGLTTVIS